MLVSAAGALADPAYPDIPGLDSFAGTVMHSARWDAGHDLTGERVAVIGTGASAIQIVPAIQPVVDSVAVYQRTPAWVVPRTDHPVTPLMRRLYRSVPGFQKAVRGGMYAFREFLVIGMAKNRRFLGPVGKLAKKHLEHQVRDVPPARRPEEPFRREGDRLPLEHAAARHGLRDVPGRRRRRATPQRRAHGRGRGDVDSRRPPAVDARLPAAESGRAT